MLLVQICAICWTRMSTWIFEFESLILDLPPTEVQMCRAHAVEENAK